MPFDGLRAVSMVERLTALSPSKGTVEGPLSSVSPEFLTRKF